MSILENLPLRRSVNFLLVLEGLGGAGNLSYRRSIPLFTEDVSNCGRTPVVRYGRWLAAIPADGPNAQRERRHWRLSVVWRCAWDARPSTRKQNLAHSLGCFSSTIQPFLFSGLQIPIGRFGLVVSGAPDVPLLLNTFRTFGWCSWRATR